MGDTTPPCPDPAVINHRTQFVLAVEAAALLRGGVRGALRRLRGGGGGSDGGGSDGGVGSETEAVMDAVADFVSGRAELRALERFDPRVVRAALEAMDTEVMEQVGGHTRGLGPGGSWGIRTQASTGRGCTAYGAL
jgi:hypothetical protein